MNPKAPPQSAVDSRSSQLTVLVFKDGFASRTFQIPLSWFSRFGLGVAGLGTLTLVAALIAAQSYRAAHRASPARVDGLESELNELHASYKVLETRLAEKNAESAIPLTAAPAAAPAPAPTVTVTVTPTALAPAVPIAASVPANGAKPLLFSALPAGTQAAPSDASSIPIEIHTPKATWGNKAFNVTFDLLYFRTDKGTQQGHIVILARGPETLFGYPDGVLNPSTRDALIAPEKGEYFSVSRFRSVRAEFTSVRKGAITEAEVLIFDNGGNLLIHSLIRPSKADEVEAPVVAPKPVVKVAPKPVIKAKPPADESDSDEPEVPAAAGKPAADVPNSAAPGDSKGAPITDVPPPGGSSP